jgi:hypothetical protein
MLFSLQTRKCSVRGDCGLEPGKQPPVLQLWLLTHRDVRTTARLRTLMQFVTGVVGHNKALLEGREGRITRPIVAPA